MDMFRIKDNKKGFTLVEIIVVLIIIAILAAIAIPAFTGYIDKTKIAVMEHNQGQVIRTLQLLSIEGELPYNDTVAIRNVFVNATNETGFYVANPLNKSTSIITSQQVAGSQGSGIIISLNRSTNWDTQKNNTTDTYLYPTKSSPNSKPKCEGSVIVQIVSEGALVYYYYDGKANNVKQVPITYKQ
jgi:type IV pilus assembly protein PilA